MYSYVCIHVCMTACISILARACTCVYIYDSHILVTLNSGAFSPHLLYMTLLRMPAAHLPLPPPIGWSDFCCCCDFRKWTNGVLKNRYFCWTFLHIFLLLKKTNRQKENWGTIFFKFNFRPPKMGKAVFDLVKEKAKYFWSLFSFLAFKQAKKKNLFLAQP